MYADLFSEKTSCGFILLQANTFHTVNNLINAHFQINASYLINAPLENCPQILGNGKIEQNQSIY